MRRWLTTWALALAAGCGLAIGATAPSLAASGTATPAPKPAIPTTPTQSANPMQVIIAHSDAGDWIAADGDIIESTAPLFERALKKLGRRKLPVFINSGGGSVQTAMAIGRMIRARGLDVAVARTQFAPCATTGPGCANGKPVDGAAATPQSESAYCASACTLILAAGTQRLVQSSAHVGVHQIWEFRTSGEVLRKYWVTRRMEHGVPVEVSRKLISETVVGSKTVQGEATDKDYKPVIGYLKSMGIDDSLMPLMLSTPHTSIRWLTVEERQSTRLVTQNAGAETLLVAAVPEIDPASQTFAEGEAVLDVGNGKTGKVLVTFLHQPNDPFVAVKFQVATASAPVLNLHELNASIALVGGRKFQSRPITTPLAELPNASIPVADYCKSGIDGRKSFTVGIASPLPGHGPVEAVMDMSANADLAQLYHQACGR